MDSFRFGWSVVDEGNVSTSKRDLGEETEKVGGRVVT